MDLNPAHQDFNKLWLSLEGWAGYIILDIWRNYSMPVSGILAFSLNMIPRSTGIVQLLTWWGNITSPLPTSLIRMSLLYYLFLVQRYRARTRELKNNTSVTGCINIKLVLEWFKWVKLAKFTLKFVQVC